jgi:hypothetical protein
MLRPRPHWSTFSDMDNTLIARCQQAHHEAVGWEYATSTTGTRAVIEHLAAELTVAGHRSAAAWLLSQLQAEVIPLRPDSGGAA